jgi:translation initiation factor 1 (eIF-1/SUI1)
MYIAETMLTFKENNNDPPTPEATRSRVQASDAMQQRHRPVNIKDDKNSRCMVCRIENNINPKEVDAKGLRTNLVKCACCGVTAHNYIVEEDSTRRIHKVGCFAGMTCFDIMHARQGFAMWKRNEDDSSKRSSAHLIVSHPIYKDLREAHGLSRELTRKRRKPGDGDEDNNIDNNH